MIFKDRTDAGEKLSKELLQDKSLLKNRNEVVIVSLLRGGTIVGKIIAEKLKVDNIALTVTKIGCPFNPELAIGAICFDSIYLQKDIIKRLEFKDEALNLQISLAKLKHKEYIKKFDLEKNKYEIKLKNRITIIVDDGIATGATIKVALLFVKSKKPKKIILAVPVTPTDFDTKGFDKAIILHKDPFFSSVSQFYENFPQVEDNKV